MASAPETDGTSAVRKLFEEGGEAAVASPRDILLWIDKGVRAVKMYLPNNPQLKTTLAKAALKIQECVGQLGEISFLVTHSRITSGEETLYENGEPATSLAFVLAKDGVRELRLRPGIEEEEIVSFIQGFNRDFTREYQDDDLVTYFWEHNFRHISYVATEDFMEEFLPPEILAAENRQESLLAHATVEATETVQEMIGSTITGGVSMPPLRPSHLRDSFLACTPEETDRVRGMVREDAESHNLTSLIQVIFNIIRREEDRSSVADLFVLSRRILELVLERGDFVTANRILGEVTAITGEEGGTGKVATQTATEGARSMRDYLSEESFLTGALAEAIIHAPEASHAGVTQFIAALPGAAGKHVLNLFEKLTTMKSRKALCAGLARMAQKDPEAILSGLDDRRWYVVRNTVYVLGMIPDVQAHLYLQKALRHADARVRREALKSVLALNTDGSEDYLLPALEDPDEKLRLFVVRSITPRHGEQLRRRVRELTSSPAFRRRGNEERRALLHLRGRIGGEDDFKFLAAMLLRRSWFGGDNRHEKEWAAEALAASDSPAARQALNEVALTGGAAAREICRRALMNRARTPGATANDE